MNRTATVITTLAVLLAVLLGFLFISTQLNARDVHKQADQNEAFISCINTWATKTAERSSIISDLSVERLNKLDIVIRDFALAQHPKTQKGLRVKFFKDLHVYIVASNHYNKAVQRHPLPKSPKVACANVKR
jgi:hypothetical protein